MTGFCWIEGRLDCWIEGRRGDGGDFGLVPPGLGALG